MNQWHQDWRVSAISSGFSLIYLHRRVSIVLPLRKGANTFSSGLSLSVDLSKEERGQRSFRHVMSCVFFFCLFVLVCAALNPRVVKSCFYSESRNRFRCHMTQNKRWLWEQPRCWQSGFSGRTWGWHQSLDAWDETRVCVRYTPVKLQKIRQERLLSSYLRLLWHIATVRRSQLTLKSF